MKNLLAKLNELNINFKVEETEYIHIIRINDTTALNVGKNTRELLTLHVPTEYQGLGLGSLLLETAKELGATELTAEANGEGMSQEDLVKFYERHGFGNHQRLEHSVAMSL